MYTVEREVLELKKKIAALEYQTRYIFERLSIEMPEAPAFGLTPELMLAVQKGDINKAISIYMDETGADIRTAKDFVNSLKA